MNSEKIAAANRIGAHLLSTLPKDIPQRRTLLNALSHLVPHPHPLFHKAKLLIKQLDAHEEEIKTCQLELETIIQSTNQ